MSLVISPVTTMDDARAIGSIAIAAWGSGPLDAVPDHMIITIARYSGVVLIGKLDNVPVTFCLSFLAQDANGELHHHSHIAATLPAHWGKGYASQIKRAQADAVLAQGIKRMTWTYDPLEVRNARLNLHKLGAVCNTYKPNVYGEMRDAINIGLDTDRFQVDWHLPHSAAAPRFTTTDPIPTLNPVTVNQAGFIVPPDQYTIPAAKTLRVVVPPSIYDIKTTDLPLGIAWREHTRDVFTTLFSQGYYAVDMQTAGDDCAYILQQRAPDWYLTQ